MNKELEDSINMLRNTDISTIENAENIDLLTYSYAVKTVLNYIENSIPKKRIEEVEYISYNFTKTSYTPTELSKNFETITELLNKQSNKINELVRAVNEINKEREVK